MHTKYVDLARTAACYRDDAQDERPNGVFVGLLNAAPICAAWWFVFLKVLGIL
jgi:hypothetical protein